MVSTTLARYRMRALMAASSIGILVGASLGSAYLGGRLVHAHSAREDAQRLNQLASMSKDGKINMAALDSLDASPDGKGIDGGALKIAMRFSGYSGSGAVAQNVLMAQNMTAMRVSTDQRLQKDEIVRANLRLADASPFNSAVVISDHPVLVRAASAMVFKAHTNNDSDCLTQAVYYEARGEGVDGMRAVAQVILNRVRHPSYPKSICAVVYQGAYLRTSCQFSFVCNGAMSAPLEAWAWRRAKSVADAALNGYVMASIGSATSFHTLTVDPIWSANMVRVAQVGSHIFYQFRGHSAHISGSADGVQPSTSMPLLVQASDITSAPDTQAMPVATPIATADPKNATLMASLSHMDTVPVKPVPASARITGRTAAEITAEVALPAAAAKAATPAAPKTQ